jgi:hypothetical protein
MALTTVNTTMLNGAMNAQEENSPAFTGSPTAPTAPASDNSTLIATTAFVHNAIVTSEVSPTFSGTPTAPTAAALTNTNQVATTAYVNAAIVSLFGVLAANGVAFSHANQTRLIFQQNVAPTGWKRDATVFNDSALRLVSSGLTVGGSSGLSTLTVPSMSVTGTTDGHTLTIAEMPSHNHYISGRVVGGNAIQIPGGSAAGLENIYTDNTGGSGAHSHTMKAAATSQVGLGVKYTDVILATKDAYDLTGIGLGTNTY